MRLLLLKIVSILSIFIFFYFIVLFYLSENFKTNILQSRKSHDSLLFNYGMKLPKTEVNKNFKIFIDNSDYFKKIDDEPKFWELVK